MMPVIGAGEWTFLAHYNRGTARAALGDHRRAIEDFDRTIELGARTVAKRGIGGKPLALLGAHHATAHQRLGQRQHARALDVKLRRQLHHQTCEAVARVSSFSACKSMSFFRSY